MGIIIMIGKMGDNAKFQVSTRTQCDNLPPLTNQIGNGATYSVSKPVLCIPWHHLVSYCVLFCRSIGGSYSTEYYWEVLHISCLECNNGLADRSLSHHTKMYPVSNEWSSRQNWNCHRTLHGRFGM